MFKHINLLINDYSDLYFFFYYFEYFYNSEYCIILFSEKLINLFNFLDCLFYRNLLHLSPFILIFQLFFRIKCICHQLALYSLLFNYFMSVNIVGFGFINLVHISQFLSFPISDALSLYSFVVLIILHFAFYVHSSVFQHFSPVFDFFFPMDQRLFRKFGLVFRQLHLPPFK